MDKTKQSINARKYYTYYIKQKDTGLFYYGVKYAKDANPKTFWKKYFTSSKYVHNLLEVYGKDSFDVQIRHTFDDPMSALEWEQKVISKIRNWDNCLNISLGGDAQKAHKNRKIKDKNGLSNYDRAVRKGTNTCRENGWYETISKRLMGKGVCSSTKKCEFCGKECTLGNYSRWHGKNCKMNPNITQEQLNKRITRKPGTVVSIETRAKISNMAKNRVTAYNLNTQTCSKVSKEEFDKHDYLVGTTNKKSPYYNTQSYLKCK